MSNRIGRSAAWSALVAAMLAAGTPAKAQQVDPPTLLNGSSTLPTGKTIMPAPQAVAGAPQNVGSFPSNMVLTPDGKYALVTDIGFREYLTCINTATGQIAQPETAPAIPKNGSVQGPPTSKSLLSFGKPYSGTDGLYFGLVISPAPNADGSYTAYAAQGVNSTIAVIKVATDGSLTQTGTITMRAGDNPAGLSLDAASHLYVANNTNSASTYAAALLPGSLVIYNTTTAVGTRGAAPEVARITLNTKTFGTLQTLSNDSDRRGPVVPFTPTSFPYAVQALPDGSKVYVSSQRDGLVYSVNPATGKYTALPTGTTTANSHPIAFTLNPNKHLLYVANAQDDSVSVISTLTDATVATIPLAAGMPAGATPNGLALSADGNTLYVTLGDMNAVAVVDVNAADGSVAYAVKGDIPVGWYPTGIAVVNGGANLLVANAKGTLPAYPNPQHVKPTNTSANEYNDTYYDESIIEGNVQDIAIPNAATLSGDTQTVLADNSPANDPGAATLSQLGLAGSGKIKHVIYIVKENRTYDQVLGDGYNNSQTLPGGQSVNGEADLAVFGQGVTPNLHTLEQRFVWLDNFYDCSEVSGDGWNWSTQSYANEYVIKNVPNNYSSRRYSYDFEGQVNNYLTAGFPAQVTPGVTYSQVFPQGGPSVPDPDTGTGGYIWDKVEGKGLTFRNYGFLINSGVTNLSPDNYPSKPGLQPGSHYTGGPLNGHTDLDFREFDLNYPDSDAPDADGNNYPLKTYGQFNAPDRFAEWNREFQAMLKTDPSGNSVPNLETIKFMSDHTNGYPANQPTPVAHVADNDYAVAELVQAVSNSPIWDSTAIFVIEDDAQDGPDHVDCHRSTAYVISPYVKPNTVDHGFHNTDSVLRSIELLLNVPSLTQYDAYAPSFGSDFAATPVNNDAYTPIAETADDVTNIASAAFLKAHPQYLKLVAMTGRMDFTKEDRAPAQLLNQVIWQSVKGMNSPMPAPRHGVFPVKATKGTVKGAQTVATDNDDN